MVASEVLCDKMTSILSVILKRNQSIFEKKLMGSQLKAFRG